jgi:hypothetical protein
VKNQYISLYNQRTAEELVAYKSNYYKKKDTINLQHRKAQQVLLNKKLVNNFIIVP